MQGSANAYTGTKVS